MENNLFVVKTSDIQNSGLFTQLYESMPQYRKQKIDSFRFAKDKYLSLAAGALLEYALTGVEKNSREIAFGSHGKPYIVSGKLHFNLSHCDGIGVCAVSDRCVGVDAEGIRTFSDRLIQRVLLPDEIKWVNSFGSPEEKDRAFLRLWTIKESVMKYLGTGLGLDPGKIDISLDDPVSARCERYDLSGVKFTEFDLDKRHITVCSQYGSFVPRPIMLTAQMILEKIKAASER
jgi:4'-phosphopantetheinyl transferase